MLVQSILAGDTPSQQSGSRWFPKSLPQQSNKHLCLGCDSRDIDNSQIH